MKTIKYLLVCRVPFFRVQAWPLIMNPWIIPQCKFVRKYKYKIVTRTDNTIVMQPHCRFCGKEKSQEELLDLKDDAILHEYFQKLEFLKVDYIDLANEFLPKTTCEYCYDAFHEAYEFFMNVKQAQIDLNVLFNAKINLKIEENENDLNPAEEDTLDKDTNAQITESMSDCEDHVIVFEPESLNTSLNKNEESINLKIEENENDLNPAEKDTLNIETIAQISESMSDCEDHVIICEPESLNTSLNKNEESIFNENLDPLTQHDFLADPNITETVTPKQIKLNEFIFICEVMKTKKTFKNIDCTVNLKVHSSSHNNATVSCDNTNIPELMRNVKKTDLENEPSTFKVNLENISQTYEETNTHVDVFDNDCDDHTVVFESLKNKQEEYFDPLNRGNFSASSSVAQTVVTQEQIENESVTSYNVNLDNTSHMSTLNKSGEHNNIIQLTDTSKKFDKKVVIHKSETRKEFMSTLNKSEKINTEVVNDNPIQKEFFEGNARAILQVDKSIPIFVKNKIENEAVNLATYNISHDNATDKSTLNTNEDQNPKIQSKYTIKKPNKKAAILKSYQRKEFMSTLNKSKNMMTKVVDDNAIESQEVSLVVTKKPEKRPPIQQADKLTPTLIKNKGNKTVTVTTYNINLDLTPHTPTLINGEKITTKVVDGNAIQSHKGPFALTKKSDKETAILQADKLTPLLIEGKSGNVGVKLSNHSTCRDGITSVQNEATNITKLKTEMDLMYKDVTAIDIDNATNTSISNNSKEIISEPAEDFVIQSKGAYIHDLNEHIELISWEGYKWFCRHCKEEFSNMSEVRVHSKVIHNTCFAFQCADCPEKFRTFNPFVEHVRNKHRILRLYCQYCNSKFESAEQCMTHTFSHWRETTVCEYCGEIFPNFDALERHNRVFLKVKKASIAHRITKTVLPHSTKSWDDYDWSCQDCWMRMPDASSVRTHVQDVHKKCFSMRCVDCLLVVQDYVQFVNHVREHRPYLLKYCQFCNMYFGEEYKLTDHLKEHCHVCHTCGQIFADITELLQHIEQYNPHKVKGVPRAVSTNTTCDVCQKTYSCPDSLKRHVINMHKKKRRRDLICQTCGKGFVNNSDLQTHTNTHNDETEKCKLCGQMFKTKYRLKCHAKTHLQERQKFVCDICGQSFSAKASIRNHILIRHENKKKSFMKCKCIVCHKTFNTKTLLKNHERQHTGARPYSCEVCKRTFTCWGNCNKHMIRIHGVTLAKTKYTARGRLKINNEIGEGINLTFDKNTEEWLNDFTSTKPREKNRPSACRATRKIGFRSQKHAHTGRF